MISVIIPSHNSEKTIENAIESVLNQDYKKRYEILVVDSSRDKTPEIVSKYPVKMIKQKPKGPAAARNLGVKKAKGDIVVFIDSDCIAPRNWLRNLVNPFSNKEIAAVAGGYRVKNKKSLVARFTDYEINERHEKMSKMERIDFVGSFNCTYRKKNFQKFGGFDTKLIQAEDADLSFRVSENNKIIFQHSAYVYHYHPDSLKKYLKQKFWRGYWKIFLSKKHKKRRLKSSYTPITLSFQMLFTFLFFLFFPLWTISKVFMYISLISFTFIYLLNIPFFQFLLKKEPNILFAAIPIILLRNITVIAGGIFGLIKLIKK